MVPLTGLEMSNRFSVTFSESPETPILRHFRAICKNVIVLFLCMVSQQ